MQKGFAPILILVGVMVLAIVAGGAYFFSKSQISKPQSSNPPVVSQTPQPTSVPSSTPDETANWKTYTSCDFSIKYPEGWNAQKYFIQDSKDSCAFLTAPDYKQGSDTRTGFSVTITRMAKGDTSTGTTINTIEDYIKSVESTIQPSTLVKNKATKTYGSLTGTQFDFDAFESTTTFIALQGKYLYLVRWPTATQYSGQYRMSIDQILSTFKFLDQTGLDRDCPKEELINCTPIPGMSPTKNCQPEFIKWAKDNCPNFKGAIY